MGLSWDPQVQPPIFRAESIAASQMRLRADSEKCVILRARPMNIVITVEWHGIQRFRRRAEDETLPWGANGAQALVSLKPASKLCPVLARP